MVILAQLLLRMHEFVALACVFVDFAVASFARLQCSIAREARVLVVDVRWVIDVHSVRTCSRSLQQVNLLIGHVSPLALIVLRCARVRLTAFPGVLIRAFGILILHVTIDLCVIVGPNSGQHALVLARLHLHLKGSALSKRLK